MRIYYNAASDRVESDVDRDEAYQAMVAAIQACDRRMELRQRELAELGRGDLTEDESYEIWVRCAEEAYALVPETVSVEATNDLADMEAHGRWGPAEDLSEADCLQPA